MKSWTNSKTVQIRLYILYLCHFACLKKGKRKVQSQAAAHPRHKEEEETDKTKQALPNKRKKSTKISSLFPKRGYRNAKRTEKYKNKITQGKT